MRVIYLILDKHENVVFVGSSGVGKTHLQHH